jgi:uncharacterized damage-inducible protein DinB
MYPSIDSFLQQWQYESEVTQRLLDLITDDALGQAVAPGDRTIGRLAWHIAQTIPEMMARTGLQVTGLGEHDPVPASAGEIAKAYGAASASFVEQLKANWTDATLAETDDTYGESWSRARTLMALVSHQTHHRGQLTVLMRQAGLPVVGVYGPAKEDWAQMGMEPPTI